MLPFKAPSPHISASAAPSPSSNAAAAAAVAAAAKKSTRNRPSSSSAYRRVYSVVAATTSNSASNNNPSNSVGVASAASNSAAVSSNNSGKNHRHRNHTNFLSSAAAASSSKTNFSSPVVNSVAAAAATAAANSVASSTVVIVPPTPSSIVVPSTGNNSNSNKISSAVAAATAAAAAAAASSSSSNGVIQLGAGVINNAASKFFSSKSSAFASYSTAASLNFFSQNNSSTTSTTTSSSSSAAAAAAIGIAGIENFFQPSNFEEMRQNAMKECENLRISLVSSQPASTPSVKSLDVLDRMSNELCKVLDLAEFVRNVHPENTFSLAADQTFQRFHAYLHRLNADTSLYRIVADLVNNRAVFESLTPEQRRTASIMKHDMEKNGIHLPDSVRQQVVQLNSKIDELVVLFSHFCDSNQEESSSKNNNNNNNNFPREAIIHASQLRGITQQDADALRKFLIPHPTTGEPILRITPKSTFLNNFLLSNAHSSDVREKAFRMLMCRSSEPQSVRVLEQLIQARQDLARTLELPSYAHLAMRGSLGASPEAVWSFLENLAEKVRPKADLEVRLIQKAKSDLEGVPNPKVNEWDYDFYSSRHKKQILQLDSSIREYFALDNCLEGLANISRNVFGLELVPAQMKPQESWREGVRKFGLFDLDRSKSGAPRNSSASSSSTSSALLLGYLYFDFFSGLPNSSHFTLRCGTRLASGEYQTPIVAVTLENIRPPSSSSSSSIPTLLTHSQLRTLFHEYGHALHALVGRTEYQNVSGTRTSLDFVETPSELMEYFTWDHRVLQRFAKHYHTGEVVPASSVQNLSKSKHMFSGLETQTQILYSMLDLIYFGDDALANKAGLDLGKIRGESSSRGESFTTGVLRALKNRYTSIPYVEGTRLHATLRHLSNYGAGYYSYLFAHAFSSSIWKNFFENDPFSAAAGRRYKEELLRHGGAKDPKEILKSLLKGSFEPDPTFWLEEMECIPPTSNSTLKD